MCVQTNCYVPCFAAGWRRIVTARRVCRPECALVQEERKRARVSSSAEGGGMNHSQSATTIGTHDGTFHCDEALACFMLRQLPAYQQAKVIRTRDGDRLKDLDVVVDVGKVYDATLRRFDHHQRGFFETFTAEKKTKLSSAGLVYKHYGMTVIEAVLAPKQVDQDELRRVYERVYDSFIESLDANDNGINQYDTDEPPRFEVNTTLPARVARLNPPWNDPAQDFDAGFQRAMELTGREFCEEVRSTYDSWLSAAKIVANAIKSRFEVHPSGSVIRFAHYVPWTSHLDELEKELDARILYVLCPDHHKHWRVRAVNMEPGKFELRRPLPAAWRGLDGDELSKVAGIDGCVFVHSAGFIGGNKTYEGVMKMVERSLGVDNAP